MVFRSTGEIPDLLVSGSDTHSIQIAVAFGISMYPFIKSGEELRLEPFKAETIRFGDIIMFRTKDGALITHRVVKVLRGREKFSFRTKGDNRLSCDEAVYEDQVLGRITHINGTCIRSHRRRFFARVIAFITYSQSVLCHLLLQSSLIRLIPKFSLPAWFVKLFNPLAWLTRIQIIKDEQKAQRLCQHLLNQGIVLESDITNENENIVNLWNKTFTGYPITSARIKKFLFQTERFKNSEQFLVKYSGALLGWVSVYPEFLDTRINRILKTAVIDVFAISDEGWQMQVEQILFPKILAWAKTKGVKRIILNDYPVSGSAEGLFVTPLIRSASKFDFEPTHNIVEFTLDSESFQRIKNTKLDPRIIIRPYQEADEPFLLEFLPGKSKTRGFFLDFTQAYPFQKKGALVAVLGTRVVGFCRWAPEEKISDYGDIEWLWTVSIPKRPKGYFLRFLVDENFRNQGIGTALAERAFDCLFQAGCQEIVLMVTRGDKVPKNFYERFGFKKTGAFLKLTRIEKG